MTQVFRYPLMSADTVLRMPKGANVIHVAMYDKTITLWAELEDKDRGLARVPGRHFVIVGTGNPIPVGYPIQHVGSVMDGPIVQHVYEILDRPSS